MSETRHCYRCILSSINCTRTACLINLDLRAWNFFLQGTDPVPSCGGKWPLGPDDLEKRDKTRPGHKIEFKFSMFQLACNLSQSAEEKEVLGKKMKVFILIVYLLFYTDKTPIGIIRLIFNSNTTESIYPVS